MRVCWCETASLGNMPPPSTGQPIVSKKLMFLDMTLKHVERFDTSAQHVEENKAFSTLPAWPCNNLLILLLLKNLGHQLRPQMPPLLTRRASGRSSRGFSDRARLDRCACLFCIHYETIMDAPESHWQQSPCP
jgi:hypothetical protein